MKAKMFILVLAVLMIFSAMLAGCASSVNIAGEYTCTGLENVYRFTEDGKIYVNDELESYSRYEVKGNKIITYIEGEPESKMEFPFKKTDDGFMMGKLEYRLIELNNNI